MAYFPLLNVGPLSLLMRLVTVSARFHFMPGQRLTTLILFASQYKSHLFLQVLVGPAVRNLFFFDPFVAGASQEFAAATGACASGHPDAQCEPS